MWGRNQDGGGRRRRARNRRVTPTLDVRARSRTKTRVDAALWLRLVGIPLSVLALLALLGVGVHYVGSLLFSRNAAFVIRNLSLDADDAVTRGYLEGKCGIRKGVNLFGFNIRDVRAEFLRFSPSYKTIQITRVLPDTVRITTVPRKPLAVIGKRKGSAVDNEGCVFGFRGSTDGLPLIVGHPGTSANPGDRVQGLASDAVHLLDVWSALDVDREMVVRTVDVRGGFRGSKSALQVGLNGNTLVDLSWVRGRGPGAADDLRQRLEFLRGILRRDQAAGRRLKSIDLTLEDYRHNSSALY